MARFGLLILNKGNWNGNQIMTDTAYFNQMTRSSQNLNPAYGYLWWLNGKASYMLPKTQFIFNGFVCPNAPADMIAAMGKNGQFINVIPSKNMMWIRMGEAPDNSEVPFLLNDQIWQYINDLKCNTGRINKNRTYGEINISADPETNTLEVKSVATIRKIDIFDIQGKQVNTTNVNTKSLKISSKNMQNKLIFIRIYLQNGETIVKKVHINKSF